MISRHWGGVFLLLVLCTPAAQATEVALVTGLSGRVELQLAEAEQTTPLKVFSKLHATDRLLLGPASRLQLVFFPGGREEVWQGPGELLVAMDASSVLLGSPQAQSRQLPAVLVKQLARTPPADGQVRAGMVRLRSMPAGGTLEAVERNYAKLRKASAAADRNPELYLLAGYFELREFTKLKQLLKQLDEQSPGNHEVAVLRALYGRAINDAKMADQQ